MLLWEIWEVSLALAAISVLAMLLLVVRRIIQTGFARRREKLRAAASTVMLDYLDGNTDAAAVRRAAGGRDDIVGELVFEMRQIVRGEGAQRLIDLAQFCGGVKSERKRLASGNPGVRIEAVRRISIYGSDAAPALEAALSDDDPSVRTAAAIELATLAEAPPLARLAERLQKSIDTQSDDLRRVFRRTVAAESRAAIALLVDGSTGDELRQLILYGLGHAGEFSALPIIDAMMHHANPEVRAEALRSLANLAHPSSGDTAIRAMGDPDWRVRAQAANCVRRIGATQAVPALQPLLDDEQWWVRFRAAEALAVLGSDGVSRLESAARHGDRAGQVAQLVLAERGLA